MAFKISFYRRRNDRTIDLREQTNTNTDKIQYSIHTKVVPLNGEEQESEYTKKERKKKKKKNENKNNK